MPLLQCCSSACSRPETASVTAVPNHGRGTVRLQPAKHIPSHQRIILLAHHRRQTLRFSRTPSQRRDPL